MNSLPLLVKNLLGVELSPVQEESFRVYARELLIWNERINLTAIREPADIIRKHFLDSLTCTFAWREMEPPASLIDIGTGAGFPGIPLKILMPGLRLTLVESIGKKADFCRHIVDTLQLENVEVITARAEEVGAQDTHREMYDAATARAVAQLNILAEYLLPLVRVGGFAIAQKGNTAPAESQQANRAITILGGVIRPLILVMIPRVEEARYLVVMKKIKPTPAAYPRRVGIPSRKPL
ncbi:MAG TPA: 16S rRNA (guanine(527)-N(7))-methyltransferase RsmG [Anaerolineaceae bacterium]|nr:16S rRNA (guanine(527)-N(7))-methyltransferase RsmG [Anaerolineaceae bacterium]